MGSACNGASPASRARFFEASGRESNNIFEYGCCGRLKNRRVEAVSTSLPLFMTATRSATWEATARSWVINSMAMPVSRCIFFSSASIRAWVVTSSAVVGSSAISKSGSPASAIASMTRCFIPPENWWGYSSMRCAGSGISTASSNSTTLFFCALPERFLCCASVSPTCFATVRAGLSEVCGSWNIMAIRLPLKLRIFFFGRARRSMPLNTTAPLISAVRGNNLVILSAVTDLPLPDSPSSAKVSPC